MIKKVGSFASVTLLIIFAFGLHVSMLPSSMGHTMEGMTHTVSSSTTCNTVCTFATVQKEENLSEHSEADDTPQLPFYTQFQVRSLASIEKQHSLAARTAIDREPPPGGAPSYIALNVFRA